MYACNSIRRRIPFKTIFQKMLDKFYLFVYIIISKLCYVCPCVPIHVYMCIYVCTYLWKDDPFQR